MIYSYKPEEPVKRIHHFRTISAETFWKTALTSESLSKVHSSTVLDKNHSIVVGMYNRNPTKKLI
jgi:hypothetical protein